VDAGDDEEGATGFAAPRDERRQGDRADELVEGVKQEARLRARYDGVVREGRDREGVLVHATIPCRVSPRASERRRIFPARSDVCEPRLMSSPHALRAWDADDTVRGDRPA